MALKIESRKPLSKTILDADEAKLAGLRRIGKRYTPQRPEFALPEAEKADAEVKAAEQAEADLAAALAAAQDRTRSARHQRHDLLVGSGEQVAGQFGKDSDEYQGMGLKKKAEYRR